MAIRDPRARAAHHTQPRWPNPTGSRSFGDATDIAGDAWHILAKEQLVPQIASRTRNAIAVDRREIFYYQRLRSGRRCSCWSVIETSPHSMCPICFATGFAGGYLKWGTDTYLFDPSRQWVGINTKLSTSMGIPPWFVLEDGALWGYVEWDQQPTSSLYYGLDSFLCEYRFGGGRLELLFKREGYDADFIPFSESALKQRVLLQSGKFRFRAVMRRQRADDTSPAFLQFWFRLMTDSVEPPVIYVDVPRKNESNVLAEYGALEMFNQIQFAFPADKIQRINLEDLMIKLEDMTRWKIIEQSPNDPLNILTSFDVQARKVFMDEAMMSVPM